MHLYMIFVPLFFLPFTFQVDKEKTLMTCFLLEFKLDMAMTSYSKMNSPINGEVEDFIHCLWQCEPSLFTNPCCLCVRMNTKQQCQMFFCLL
jgi:hypothetical protein